MRLEPPSADDPAPPYEQLRAQIAGRIASGDLPAGERLPTVRALADQAGLAVNTAARVYRELEADGLISTEGRRGSFVRAGAGASTAPIDQEADTFATAARRVGLTRAQAVRALEAAWERGGR